MSERITQPTTSVNDDQRFELEKEVTVVGNGEPVLTIVNERVSFENNGTAQTTGNTPTINVQADGASIDNREHGVILSELSGIQVTADDVEIDNDGLIEAENTGIVVISGADAEIRNDGEIEAGNGIFAIASDDAHIRNDGEIDAVSGGIVVSGDDAYIQNRGEVDAGRDGIVVSGDDGEVVNRGDIDAGDVGIEVNGDNTDVDNRGNVNSDVDGLRVLGQNVDVDNRGTISGDVNGVNFVNGGESSGRLNNRGTIESDSRAVNIGGDGVEVDNRGDIRGTGDQRNGTIYSDATADNFTINNQRSGSVDAGLGNQGAGIALQIGDEPDDTVRAEVTNAGSIDGRGQGAADSGLAGDGLRIFSGVEGGGVTFLGDVRNSGSISSESEVGATSGLRIADGVNFDGQILNESRGLIEGANNGLYFGDAEHNAQVVNRGTIQSGSRAVNIDGTGVALENYGDILGTDDQRNGTVYSDATADNYSIVNQRSGVIDAGAQNSGAGIALQTGDSPDDTVNAEVVNRGTIEGRGQAAADSGLAGDGLRIFSGVEGGGVTFAGDITNAGRISSESDVGATAGLRISDGVGFEGTITNESRGLIEGENNGLYFGDAEHDATVVNRGTIQSGSRAVNIDGTGVTLNNLGDILGTGDQRNGTVYADVTADDYTVLNQRSGTIDAGAGNNGSGIALQLGEEVTASVFNAGEVFGRGVDPATGEGAAGVRLFSGVGESEFDGDIVNEGLISSEQGEGINIEDDVDFFGDIQNRGTIQAGNDGIEISGALSGDILNDGRIVAENDGIDLNGGADFSGSIVNNGSIEADDSGIDIADVDSFNGDIVNNGTITGDADGDGDGLSIDAEDAEVDLTVVNNGVLNGDVQLGSGDDVFDGANGEVNGEVDGGAGNDTITSGEGDNVLTGGEGSDSFVFVDGTDDDSVTDFEDGSDLLDVSAFFDDAADAVAAARQDGADTVIDLDNNDSVRLVGVDLGQIDQTDFLV